MSSRIDMEGRFWMIRAGSGAYLIDEFLDEKIVAIGWNEIGNLNDVNNIEELKKKLQEAYPGQKQRTVNMNAGQIYRFRNEFSKNDFAVTYNPSSRQYHIGKIKSDYYFTDQKTEFYNNRDVEWEYTINRDDLTVTTKNSLGSIATIFEITDSAKNEIIMLMTGEELQLTEGVIGENDELESIKDDIIEKAYEFIKDQVMSLAWDEMQELVASIFRAMGYKTKISGTGSDRGKDIIASPDGLGLEDPRIIIEVKHRQGSMGSQELRSFIGGIRQGTKGVYVSTGGFTKDAKYEADRSNIPITMIDSNYLVELIVQYYDNFDNEGRTLVPLRKIFWPI